MRRKFQILVVKIAAIGDVVMALPFLNKLREKYPHAEITWICGTSVAALLKATQLIDRIIIVDEKRLLKGSFFQRFSEILKVWRKISFSRFDIRFILHPDPRYHWIAKPIFCCDTRTWGRSGNRYYPVPGRYHVEEYLQLLEKEVGPVTFEIRFPRIFLKNCAQKYPIVIAPGGAKNVLRDDALRRWPILSYAHLIRLLNQHDIAIAVTGNKEDEWILPSLEGLSFVNLVGKLDLLDLISLLQHSQLLITHDSGPLHLAKLSECYVIALFGPTNPWEKVSSKEKINVFWGGERLSCRPCYNGKTYSPCRNNACLASISPEMIYREVLRIISPNHKIVS